MDAAIVTAADAKYFRYLNVLLRTLHFFNVEDIPIIIVDLGLTETQKAEISSHRHFLKFVNVDAAFQNWRDSVCAPEVYRRLVADEPPARLHKRYCWLRKLMLHTIEGPERLIWLDTDIILTQPLRYASYFPENFNGFAAFLGRNRAVASAAQTPELEADITKRYADIFLTEKPVSANFNSGVMSFERTAFKHLVEAGCSEIARQYPAETFAGKGLGNFQGGDQALLNLAVWITRFPIVSHDEGMNHRWSALLVETEHLIRGHKVFTFRHADGWEVPIVHYAGYKPGKKPIPDNMIGLDRLFQHYAKLDLDWSV